MKSLFQYIIEARGVVTDSNSWSGLVDYLVGIYANIPDNEDYFVDGSVLPGWMDECIIRKMDWVPGGIASYADDESALIGNRMSVTINLSNQLGSDKNRIRTTLEHEFQHAFDDWIGRYRRGKDTFLDDDYCVPIGYEGPGFDDINQWDILVSPQRCTFDHMFYLLRESTYWFSPTEINAFLREFSIYIKSYVAAHGNQWNWNDIHDNPNNGALPLIGMEFLHYVYDNINKYTGIDKDDLSWEYIMEGLNAHWADIVFGHKFPGKDKQAFRKVIGEIIKKKAGKAMSRYMRVLKDSGAELMNMPEWFK